MLLQQRGGATVNWVKVTQLMTVFWLIYSMITSFAIKLLLKCHKPRLLKRPFSFYEHLLKGTWFEPMTLLSVSHYTLILLSTIKASHQILNPTYFEKFNYFEATPSVHTHSFHSHPCTNYIQIWYWVFWMPQTPGMMCKWCQTFYKW